MNSRLLLSNIPYNCSDGELREWVEPRGVQIRSIRVIRDLVANVSPAFGYVELENHHEIDEAVASLNGKKLRNQTIQAKRLSSAAKAANI